jgi:NodT family efflux transporter outer membrane factor (OMF) lipoprotein
VKPEISAPKEWSAGSGVKTGGQQDTQALAYWWATLKDPELTSLIERAVQSNLDLREATARVREAHAKRGFSRSDQFPSIDASGSASKSKNSTAAGGGVQNLYSAGFDASWELDIFGGKRRAVEATQADLEASVEDRSGVLVTLASEVALNYVEVRSNQTRLAVAEANRDSEQETYQLTQWRYEAGLVTQLDVEQAKSNLEQTKAQIPTLETNLAAAKNRLAVLLGKHPGSLDNELDERKPIPRASLDIVVGVPADSLRNRPDVRQKERQLAAETARIGVAKADLYPKFTLSGSIGVEALSAKGLTSAGSGFWGISLPFSWNIFDAGRIRQSIEVQNAVQEQALIQYESSILSALEEVENALVAFSQEQRQRRPHSGPPSLHKPSMNQDLSIFRLYSMHSERACLSRILLQPARQR